MTRTVPILMYHALSQARTSGFHRWTLSGDRLRSHLDYLSSNGYRTVTIAGLLDRYRRGGPAPDEKLVALTFDDAYADFHAVALPLLVRYGLTGTLFVPTGYVGGRSGWMHGEGEGERTILSWAGLAEIAGCGIEIGAHSHTHPQMDRLTEPEMAKQAVQPKAELEDRLGLPVTTFAYPYGRYDRRVRDAVAAAGYRGACTMNSWAATTASPAFELPRTAVLHYMDTATLAAELAVSRSRIRRAALRASRAATAPVRRLRTRTGHGLAPGAVGA
jgi:peptidoglycan/xylan/chitin deacetylase (PgdA/CDA1 family)